MRKVLIWVSLLLLAIMVGCLYIVLSPSRKQARMAETVPAKGCALGVVVCQPSLSAVVLNRVLAFYGSPASGKGQALYDLGVSYGIDPAYALAFFMHESSFGRAGYATITRSLGNIICTPGYSLCVGRFRAYVQWEDGFRDWYRLIRDEYAARGLDTVARIIPVYAPSADHNNVSGYVYAVDHAVEVWRSGHVAVNG
ncbi:glucosaminidase domain-containing protein [Ktedonobacter robiniae]|uniref:Mannosyl-glycoprotein endo-beta-N-acetylglucosamidase-like domain-containing protein n=1 Tax=Ktedonobacter robiniae TaxID=2778365 RepID=A0ABQ3UJJ0_9CHLR|nr:glucosaminidase domain-containing protein [Ktedonobacter robiniae]GHO52896.1 hypothetical protein KSB_13710 [Ktedonobacter robiniae]